MKISSIIVILQGILEGTGDLPVHWFTMVSDTLDEQELSIDDFWIVKDDEDPSPVLLLYPG